MPAFQRSRVSSYFGSVLLCVRQSGHPWLAPLIFAFPICFHRLVPPLLCVFIKKFMRVLMCVNASPQAPAG